MLKNSQRKAVISIWYQEPKKILKMLKKIEAEHGVQIMIHVFDLSIKNVDQLVKNCPKIDILVNNAGAIPAGDIQAMEEDRWRAAWDLKVFGYINMTSILSSNEGCRRRRDYEHYWSSWR